MNRLILVPTWVFLLIVCLLTGGVIASITITPGAPTAIPSGGIILTVAASCPGSTTEYTTARGRFMVGVPAAGTIEGTVGTALTNTQNPEVTPIFTGSALATHTHTATATGTVAAPTFTGSALGTHQHEIPVVAGTTWRGGGSVYGTGESQNIANDLTRDADTATSTALMLSRAISAGTPAGTNSAPAFTGSEATSGATGAGTPAGTNNAVTTGGIAPYIQLRLCQQ